MNLYVGNLPHSHSEAQIRTAFEQYGAVSSVALIKDKFTGQPRGFGFVEMPNQGEANQAIAGLNGQDLGGRTLTVNEARPREERSNGGGSYGGGGNRSFGGGGNRRF